MTGSESSPFLTRYPSPITYYFSHRAISSVVERLLHTQEVAGSNPASRTPSIEEQSPRRRVAGSNPAPRTISSFHQCQMLDLTPISLPMRQCTKDRTRSEPAKEPALTHCPHQTNGTQGNES